MNRVMEVNMRRKTAIRICLVLCVCLIISSKVKGADNDALDLYATYCSVIDSETGRILYEKKGDVQVPMASTTKILTCILILEEGNLDDYALTSQYASSMPKVHMGAREGEYYMVEDLLYALMLESYNDAAVILAEYLCGDVKAFANLMNEKAMEIGCENYHFVTPNGLDGTDDGGEHSITSTDLSKIMAYCTTYSPQKEKFIQITTTASHLVEAYKKDGEQYKKNGHQKNCVNRNTLLSNPLVVSGKTGFTNNAGYCYVCQTEINNRRISFAILACGWPNNRNYKWSDSKEIINYIQENYKEQEVKHPELDFGLYPEIINEKKRIGAGEFQCPEIKLSNDSDVYFLSEADEIHYIFYVDEYLEAPIVEGTIVGELQVYINEERMEKIPLYLTEKIEENTYVSCLWEVFDYFIIQLINIDFF